MRGNATAPQGAQAAPLDPEAALAVAQHLQREAFESSRLAKQHHQRARSLRKKLQQFVADLEAMGIKVVLEDLPKPHSPRRHSDHRSASRT